MEEKHKYSSDCLMLKKTTHSLVKKGLPHSTLKTTAALVAVAIGAMATSAFADESVTGIITDFGGFFESYQDNQSSVTPDAAHNLLGFQQDGIIYSTDVNDQLLTDNGITFNPATFRALVPLEFISPQVGQGSLDDGDPTNAIEPIYPIENQDVTAYMIDGINGLGFSTFGNNVASTANYNISKIDVAALSDGAPEFLYFNNAAPSGSLIVFKLFNAADVQLGVDASSVENSHPSIATNSNDRFDTTAPPVAADTNQIIEVQGLTLSFADFGITAEQLETAVRLEVTLPASADPPFIAYNTDSILVCALGDDDNDGLCNLVESATDSDNDNINDDQDTDSDNDSIPDVFEGAQDSDGDSIPDFLDTDSDGDGILDADEDTNMPVASGIDTDSDGIDDIYDVDQTNGTDANGNGFDDALEPTDSDGDGIYDYQDADSDNDGIADSLEAPNGMVVDTDNDGTSNHLDTDSDGDGINDIDETSVDSDNDGLSNYVDTDSDNDGVDDSVEGIGDADNDSIPDFLDNDGDNDGISDVAEGTRDSDSDGTPDSQDSDSDNDGIPDSVESGNNPNGVDSDGDGVPDYRDIDADNDGLLDVDETAKDSDSSGLPNYLDLDSDHDTLSDLYEAGGADEDGDGRIDNFVDANDDGWDDGIASFPLPDTDSDGEGLANRIDNDSDNDGVSDFTEAHNFREDLDGNGRVDNILDNVSNGLSDGALISPADVDDQDSDGIPDHLDPDSDNDGVPDLVEAGGQDINGDGLVDSIADDDGDTIPNSIDADFTGGADTDTNGIDDSAEHGFNTSSTDTDGDGIIDERDPDADGDGFADVQSDGSGAPSLSELPDLNGNGIPDITEPGFGFAAGVVIVGPTGCSISSSGAKDPLLPLLGLTAFMLILRRRVRLI